MGFFGKLWKGVKNIFSGIGNFVKSAFSGKNWWKTALVGATAYFGGAALGYWNPAGTSSIYGKFSGAPVTSGDLDAPASSKGGWFGALFGANRNDAPLEGTFALETGLDGQIEQGQNDMAAEFLGGEGWSAPKIPLGQSVNRSDPRLLQTAHANNTVGASTFGLGERPPIAAGQSLPLENLTTGGGEIAKTGQGLLAGAANLGTKTQEYLLGPKGDSKDWGMAGNPWVQYGMLNAGASIFSDSAEEEAYGKAMGEGRALQNLNQPGNVSSGSRFTQPRQSASARQTQGTPKDEAIRMALATMTPEQKAAYMEKLYLEGEITRSEQTQFA